jgi:Cdc6-like AAA superfamily ATPase
VSDETPENEMTGATDARDATGAADASGAAAEARDADTVAPRDLDRAQARLAYSIIQTLLTHTTVTGDLVALMAQVLDRDTLEALTNTPHWAAYLDSRRALERAREQLEQFTEILNRLGEEN